MVECDCMEHQVTHTCQECRYRRACRRWYTFEGWGAVENDSDPCRMMHRHYKKWRKAELRHPVRRMRFWLNKQRLRREAE